MGDSSGEAASSSSSPTSCRGIAIVRLEDRQILCQQHVSGEDAVVDPVLWSDAVTKCAALREKTVDRLSYPNRPKQLTVYAVVRLTAGVGAVSFMSESVGQRIGYLSCDKALDLFTNMFVERPAHLNANACKSFDKPLIELLQNFRDSATVDARVAKVKRAVEDAKEIALENVDRMVERGERIESMVEQTEHLQDNAFTFRNQATTFRRQLWWNDMKMKLTVAGVVGAFLLVVYLIYCGGFSCSSSSDQKK